MQRLLTILLTALMLVLPAAPARADSTPAAELFSCDGSELEAVVNPGAVDATGIPNISGGTAPGAYVVLRWREVTLQLPRTNNAGPPSFSDGKWWWSLEDPEHPRFRLRRGLGDIEDFSCSAQAASQRASALAGSANSSSEM